MAKNITLMGADYPDVPAVQLPQTGGGTATFYDINVIDDLNSDSSTDALSAKQGKVLKEVLSNPTMIATTMVSNRAELLSGGHYQFGKICLINIKFKAKASATNSPQIGTALSAAFESALSCIDITSGISSEIKGQIPAGVATNGRIYAKSIETDHIYALTGVYITT